MTERSKAPKVPGAIEHAKTAVQEKLRKFKLRGIVDVGTNPDFERAAMVITTHRFQVTVVADKGVITDSRMIEY